MTTLAINKPAYFKKIGYEPHSAGQWEFHNSRARFRVAVCGRRYGKSTMAGRDLEPSLFLPGRRYWIVGPTYDLGEKEFRVIWDDLIVGKKMGRDKRIRKSYNKKQGDMYIEFPWGTRVEVRSADHPELLVGDGLHGVIMSEAAKHKRETWERFIRSALVDYRGWATFATTPEGYNWLHTLWQFGQDPDLPDYQSWRFPSWENPIVYPLGYDDPEIQLLLRTTSEEWFLQEIGADFSAFVGKIYSEWDESLHVRQVPFNPRWPSYVAFDWGFTNPLAAIFFQVSPQDDVYVWREHYKAYTPIKEHVRLLKGMDLPEGFHLDLGFGDAEDPEAAMEMSTLYVNTIADPAAKNNWRQGVDLVKRFLKEYETGETDEYGAPKTRPKFFVDHSCKNTIREFNNYRAADGTKKSNPRENAIRIDNHALDAIRYGLMHIFELGAKHHLEEVADDAQPVRYAKDTVEVATTLDMIQDYEGIFSLKDEF